MHQNVDYSGLTDPVRKREAAIIDIQKWIGPQKFRECEALFKTYRHPIPLEAFRFYCELAGIKGYPAQAWRETLWPEVLTEGGNPSPMPAALPAQSSTG